MGLAFNKHFVSGVFLAALASVTAFGPDAALAQVVDPYRPANTSPVLQQPQLTQRDYRMQAVNPVPYLVRNTNRVAQNPGGNYVPVIIDGNVPVQGNGEAQPGAPRPTYGYAVWNPQPGRKPVQPAPQPVAAVPPAKDPLKITTGFEVGGQLSYYHYQERNLGFIGGNDINIREDGLKYGLTGVLTGSLYGDWFAKLDTRFAMGDLTYEGFLQNGRPINIYEIPNYITEVRGFIGHDFTFGDFAISPMVGIGYRYLFDNAHDSSSASGYGRTSQYLFFPVAVNPRIRLSNDDVVSLHFEYDHLLIGYQTSYLSDISPGFGDFRNTQDSGFGLRGELNYKTNRWSFGPFFNYWNINDSEIKDGLLEPHNQTLEMGVQFRYKLWQPGDDFWPGSLSR